MNGMLITINGFDADFGSDSHLCRAGFLGVRWVFVDSVEVVFWLPCGCTLAGSWLYIRPCQVENWMGRWLSGSYPEAIEGAYTGG